MEMIFAFALSRSISVAAQYGIAQFMTGCERKAVEYGTLLERAGFQVTHNVPTPSPYSVIEAVRQ